MSKTKIGFISLGCPKNRVDTELMLHELIKAGYEITGEEIEADLILINTCAFIESAKKESIDNILDVAWLKENRSLRGIVVTGCLSERYREEILENFPEVDAVAGVGAVHEIAALVREVDEATKNPGKPAKRPACFPEMSAAALGGERVITTPEYTAYLKIAEGCDNRCSYCAIPMIRGGFRSRPEDELIAEARELEGLGVRELILVAQDTTRYGVDLDRKGALPAPEGTAAGEYRLARLLHRLKEETGIRWIRLLYCYPDKITDELIEEIRGNERVVKYIDMPVQHISDPVLKRMNRHGDGAMIREVLRKLRERIPGIVIRSTAIAGFPGESEKDFEELCLFVSEAKFERFGVFPYSREEDTPAFDLPGQLGEQQKQDRADQLMARQLEITERYNRSQIGRTLAVLCEGYDEVAEIFYGRSEADAPEIDGKVYFRSDFPVPEGAFVSVKIEEALDYDLTGEAVGLL